MPIRLAALYECDVADLTGDDRIAAATYTKSAHAALPAVQRALTTYRHLAPGGGGARTEPCGDLPGLIRYRITTARYFRY
ncbi:hypothetical protein ABZY31_11030 [Streptomyces sp. NPDC006529]|uniref:hypothetical protein n=1 Tax=Streptomyces sp. NPDC006529 TaxID=3157177 RepID=UPI0033B28BF5